MALASQTARHADRHRYMTSARRRRAPRLVIAAGVLGLLVAGAWWTVQWWTGNGAASDPDAGEGRANAATDRVGDVAAGSRDDSAARSSASAPASILPPEPPPDAMVGADPPSLGRGAAADAASAAARDAANGSAPDAAPSIPPAGRDAAADAAPPTLGAGGASESANDGRASPPSSSESQGRLLAAISVISTDPVRARRELTRLLDSSELDESQRRRAYDAINEVNQPLFFRSGVVQGDPVFATHRVAEGETPTFIVRALGAKCDSDLLLRVNGIADARRIRPGQALKVPKGAFHAEVRKGEYRINLYHGDDADRVMIASYPVGLGEFNTTPTGIFKVRPRSKLKDPQWRNPRTGEHFASDDPKNPIGERWIGLEGVEPHNQDFAGYGIHGTIEPESVGQMRSMGCIRMLGPDVEVVYEMLTVPDSTIVIAP